MREGPSNATIDWNPLGEVYYRKVEVYSMLWKDRVDLNKYVAAGGTYGGPIALVKKDAASGATNQKPVIYIFTAAGQEQAAFKWDGGKLIQMGWSSSEELICVSEDGAVFMYDMFGSYIKQFSFGNEVQRSYVLRAEVFASHFGTGVCVLSGDYQFFVINNVNEFIQLTFMLFLLQSYSPRVDDYLRAVKDHLHEAVTDCLRAAGHLFDEKEQRELMRAASFGKSFVQDMRPQAFVEMAHTIRILNNIRNFKIGIPITYDQLQRLTLPVLIDRLIARRFFFLAVKICNYMKIPKKEGVSRVLAHWACYKVQQDTVDENQLAREIHNKLRDTPGISFTEIATKAYNRGKSALAIELLDYEPRSAEQVPLLMKMGKTELALQKAIESGETELIYSVTTYMRDHLPSTEFLMKIRLYPVAASLLMKICKTQDRSFLINLCYQDDKYQNLGALYIQESFVEKNLDSRIKGLDKARIEFGKAQDPFKAQVTEDNIKLLEFQSRLQDQFGDQYLNKTIGDTLYQLIHKGYYKKADQLKKEFAIPDVRFWWTKIQALGASHAWKELEIFSKSKKSPIGYEPFVEACHKFGNNKVEAEKYMSKVPLDKKVQLFLKIGYYDEAAEAAFQSRSHDDLNLVASKASNNRSVQEKINIYRTQLSQGVPAFSLKGKGFSLS
ncbi:vacuolar protein sorting-associated protein 16 homolog [Clytia hemisphaerica]|uniref:vacuolar protein sorting-associated protein 16 homolog n=1 Tax=Clytia hemisphaerica TaxID=252671 RepID=UPI0034D5B52F